MKKKTVLIVVGVLAGLLLLCLLCGGGFILLFYSVMKEGFEVRESRFYDMCKASKNFTPADYDEYFSENYREEYSFNDTKELVKNFFPTDYDCENLKNKNILKFFTSGESLSVSTVNGETTIEYSREGSAMTLEKEDGEYKIISTTEVK